MKHIPAGEPKMKTLKTRILLFLALLGLWVMDTAPDRPWIPVFVGDAEAIIGLPFTPLSFAGVARRTTRRAVFAGAAVSTAYTAQAVQAQSYAAASASAPPPAPAAAPSSPAFPAGTTVSALPAGCTSESKDGGDVFKCGGTVYKPEYKSGNLVYVVQ